MIRSTTSYLAIHARISSPTCLVQNKTSTQVRRNCCAIHPNPHYATFLVMLDESLNSFIVLLYFVEIWHRKHPARWLHKASPAIGPYDNPTARRLLHRIYLLQLNSYNRNHQLGHWEAKKQHQLAVNYCSNSRHFRSCFLLRVCHVFRWATFLRRQLKGRLAGYDIAGVLYKYSYTWKKTCKAKMKPP